MFWRVKGWKYRWPFVRSIWAELELNLYRSSGTDTGIEGTATSLASENEAEELFLHCECAVLVAAADKVLRHVMDLLDQPIRS